MSSNNHKVWNTVYDNSVDCFYPEVWAQESLMVLESEMVMAGLVHRDFSREIAMAGDVVNTRRPANFVDTRKDDSDDITIQNAEATNVPVALNQHHHVSFVIRDGEEAKGFQSLFNTFMYPAVSAIAQGVDNALCTQCYQFLGNLSSSLGTTATKTTINAVGTKLDNQKVPLQGRNFVVNSTTKGQLLNITEFTDASVRGDGGRALRNAALGHNFGFEFYMTQNMPSFTVASGGKVTTAINLSAGYIAGTTSIVIDACSPDPIAGGWLTVAGDMTPQFVTAYNDSTKAVTIYPGLASAVVDGAVVTYYRTAAVNLSGGYAAAYQKALTIDTGPIAAAQGQMISTGTVGATKYLYGAFNTPTTTSLTLERPLEGALANDAVIGLGPQGNYNLAFHKNAIALVSRPMPTPIAGGIRSFVADLNGLGIRVTIGYDMNKQGHIVTADLLCGIKILDTNLGTLYLN